MIHFSKYLFFSFLGSVLISCSVTKELPVKTTFDFNYDDQNYQIISINAQDGEGMNYLLGFDNNSTVLRCLDQDQDGSIEIIQYGDLSLDQVNMIYHFGIQKAIEAGKFKSREGHRIYEVANSDTLFTIETLGNYTDQLYNRFIVSNLLESTYLIYWDLDADGVLDQKEGEVADLNDVQKIYQRVLQIGLEESRIQVREGKYVVLFQMSTPSS